MPVRIVRRLLLLGVVVIVSGCRLDAVVGVTVAADGSGDVAVTATVDQDVVDRVPGLAGSLALDDATAAGWAVEGPAVAEGGGLTVTLRHPFATVQEAANLLNSLGPPITGIAFERTATDDEVAMAMSGTLTLPGGTWDAFGDQALLAASGGTPFGQQLAESQAAPASSMSVELSVRLPGEVTETTGDRRDGAVVWSAPLDGSTQDLATRSVLRAGSTDGWAGPVSTIALVVLIAWLAIGAVLVVLVVRARARRRNRPFRRVY
jgi:phosphatidylinositol mannoside-binding LppM-like protein